MEISQNVISRYDRHIAKKIQLVSTSSVGDGRDNIFLPSVQRKTLINNFLSINVKEKVSKRTFVIWGRGYIDIFKWLQTYKCLSHDMDASLFNVLHFWFSAKFCLGFLCRLFILLDLCFQRVTSYVCLIHCQFSVGTSCTSHSKCRKSSHVNPKTGTQLHLLDAFKILNRKSGLQTNKYIFIKLTFAL